MRKLFFSGLLLCLSLNALGQQETEKPSYQQTSQATQSIAEQYFNAYISLDWDIIETLLAETGGFEDPTAELVFGQVKRIGKNETMKGFREGYAGITQMTFNPQRTFFSGQYAIFEGTLDWSIKLTEDKIAETKAMPFVTILKVVNGQVVEHKDFAHYGPFFEAVSATRK
ncbi:MAG: nuclear transport factor 2 family protein [Kangiellaceae bacterium]|nr:nuclear transport factor 2 family protein [Kangiellaceae bacterium]